MGYRCGMRVCRTCHRRKSEDDFYSQPRNHCKECVRARVKQHRTDNAEHYRAYDNDRAMEPHRVAARDAYAKTAEGREAGNAAKRAWQARNQVKRAAHVILGNAVRDGKIAKPTQCQRCGSTGRIHAHHDDYTKPLDVGWLCTRCHREKHACNGLH